MNLQKRIRKAAWGVWIWFKVWRAWERNDYPRMIALLEALVAKGEDSSAERILLGVAFARQSYLTEALQHFERVTRHDLLKAFEPVFFNEYASALYKAGRATDAVSLLRDAPVDRFPAAHRRWATDFLKALGHADPPPLNGKERQCGLPPASGPALRDGQEHR